jgi:hypothetical protein
MQLEFPVDLEWKFGHLKSGGRVKRVKNPPGIRRDFLFMMWLLFVEVPERSLNGVFVGRPQESVLDGLQVVVARLGD